MSKQIEWPDPVWMSNGILKKVLEGKIIGKRPKDCSRQRWADRINVDLNKCSQGVTIRTVAIDINGGMQLRKGYKLLGLD